MKEGRAGKEEKEGKKRTIIWDRREERREERRKEREGRWRE